MKTYLKHVLVTVTMACFTMLAQAELKISDAWVKPTVPGQPVAAAYMKLASDQSVDVVEALSPVAEKTEIHSMSMDGNIMRMKRLDRLQLKAGQLVELKPGGFHVMFIGLHHQIKEGEVVPISLVTQDAHGNKTTTMIKALAAAPKATEPAAEGHMHH